MSSLWNKLTVIGLPHTPGLNEGRSLVLTNRISIVLFGLSLLMFTVYAAWFPWNQVTTFMLLTTLAIPATLLFNRYGWTNVSRIWLSVLLPIVCFVVSLVRKHQLAESPEGEFYEYRIIMMTSAVIPCLVFTLREKKRLLAMLGIHLLSLIAYDPVHNLLGVGYYQLGQHDPTYYFTNLVFVLAFLLFTGAILFLKKDGDVSEGRHHELIRNLNSANRKLEERNAEIESQNKMIVAQSEVLNDHQLQLTEAYQLIERQKELLSRENKNLEGELVEKNKELTRTNAELIKYNTELRQFSFTVSHNLRSPVASLLGLADIVDATQLDQANREIIQHIKDSAKQLDGIINDLNKIVDIRHDIFKVRQRIDLFDEIVEIKKIFSGKLAQHNITIDADLTVAQLYSVKPMVHSILYNLISNSIKYRSPQRPLKVVITSSENINYYLLQVTDNGLGIDLTQHRDNLFRLYKRFHLQIDGKGLGLYLVKLQCESLGGFIDVESEPNKFTRFTVYLKKPANVSRQILFNEPHALIFYDAMINSMGIIWRQPSTSQQYREVFLKCVEFLNVYHTPNWISDISSQGNLSPHDLQWMLKEIIPAAISNGLRQIAWVKAKNPDHDEDGISGLDEGLDENLIDYAFFTNFEAAAKWIRENHESTIKSVRVNGVLE